MIHDMGLRISCSFSFLCQIYSLHVMQEAHKHCNRPGSVYVPGLCHSAQQGPECRAGGHPLLMQMGFILGLLKLGPGLGGGLQWKIKIGTNLLL